MRVMVLVVVLVVVLLMLMLMLVVVVVRMRVLLRSWPNSSNAVPPVEHNTLQPIDLINCPPIVWTAQRQRIPPKGQQQLIELVEREKGKRQSRRGVKPQIIKAKGKRKREREKCAKSGRRHKRWRGTLLLAGTRQRQSLVAGRQCQLIMNSTGRQFLQFVTQNFSVSLSCPPFSFSTPPDCTCICQQAHHHHHTDTDTTVLGALHTDDFYLWLFPFSLFAFPSSSSSSAHCLSLSAMVQQAGAINLGYPAHHQHCGHWVSKSSRQ